MLLAMSLFFQVAGGTMLFLAVLIVLGAFRDRDKPGSAKTCLGRAESAALLVAVLALGVFGLTGSGLANVIWIVAMFTAVFVAAVRRRRGEARHPSVVVDDALRADIVSLLSEDQTIEAVKLVRGRTGAGLVAAKQAVDRVAAAEGLAAKKWPRHWAGDRPVDAGRAWPSRSCRETAEMTHALRRVGRPCMIRQWAQRRYA